MNAHDAIDLRRRDAIARARSVADTLIEAAPRIEEARELPDDVVDALHDARIFRLLLPRTVGGDEIDLRTHAEVLEILARADASAAWCVSQGSGCAMGVAYMPHDAARRLFGPSNAVLAFGAGIQGKAIAVDGGYRVSGKWTFASGSMHATVLGGHSYVFEPDGSPRLDAAGKQLNRTPLFLREKAHFDDVWHVMGLKGTGSNTFSVDDLFVPEDEVLGRDDPTARTQTGPLYKFASFLGFGVGFSALQLGIASGMIEDLKQLALTKTARDAPTSMRESPVFLTDLAKMEGRLRAVRAYLHSTVEETFARAAVQDALSLDDRMAVKLATVHTINEAVEVATSAYRAAGSTAILSSNRFEHRLRDAYSASQQLQARATNYLTVGRHLLGLEPDTMTTF